MDAIYLICYSDSEENIKISLTKGIVGANNRARIPAGQLIYLVVKREGKWTVVGKAEIDSECDDNPFKKPNRLRTYKIKKLVECKAFPISDICKEELGNNYGLILRSPRPITSKSFIDALEKRFK